MRYTTAVAIMLLGSNFFCQAPPQAQKPLGGVELLALRIDGVSSERLAKVVADRGIDFHPEAEFVRAMTEAGAQENLLVALNAAKPAAGSEHSGPTVELREAPALEHLARAVELNRNDFHPEDAEPECRAAVQADPANAFAHLALGSMLRKLGRGQQAVAEFREALRLQPDLIEAHVDLAWALSGERQVEAAIDEFRQAVRLEPDNASAHRGLGVALEVKGDTQAGQAEKAIAEQLDPHSSVPTRIFVGGQVMESKLVYAPRPKYPREAHGPYFDRLVRLEVLVGADGRVKDLKVERGNTTLARAATEAVSRWTYRPTTLNGRAVEVITEIDVNFER